MVPRRCVHWWDGWTREKKDVVADSDIEEFLGHLDSGENNLVKLKAETKRHVHWWDGWKNEDNLATCVEWDRWRGDKHRERPDRGKSEKKIVSSPSPRFGRCFNCGNTGYWARDCKAENLKYRCYQCRERGHIERNCPNRLKSYSEANETEVESIVDLEEIKIAEETEFEQIEEMEIDAIPMVKVEHVEVSIGIGINCPNAVGIPLVSLSSGAAETVCLTAGLKRKLDTLSNEEWDSIMKIGDYSEVGVALRRPLEAKRRKIVILAADYGVGIVEGDLEESPFNAWAVTIAKEEMYEGNNSLEGYKGPIPVNNQDALLQKTGRIATLIAPREMVQRETRATAIAGLNQEDKNTLTGLEYEHGDAAEWGYAEKGHRNDLVVSMVIVKMTTTLCIGFHPGQQVKVVRGLMSREICRMGRPWWQQEQQHRHQQLCHLNALQCWNLVMSPVTFSGGAFAPHGAKTTAKKRPERLKEFDGDDGNNPKKIRKGKEFYNCVEFVEGLQIWADVSMSHRKFIHPRHGSLGFFPRKRARHHRGKDKSFPRDNPTKSCKMTAFMGYKTGMNHFVKEVEKSGSKLHKKETCETVTVFEIPPMVIVGVVACILCMLNTVWARHLSEELRMRFYKNWYKDKEKTILVKADNHNTTTAFICIVDLELVQSKVPSFRINDFNAEHANRVDRQMNRNGKIYGRENKVETLPFWIMQNHIRWAEKSKDPDIIPLAGGMVNCVNITLDTRMVIADEVCERSNLERVLKQGLKLTTNADVLSNDSWLMSSPHDLAVTAQDSVLNKSAQSPFLTNLAAQPVLVFTGNNQRVSSLVTSPDEIITYIPNIEYSVEAAREVLKINAASGGLDFVDALPIQQQLTGSEVFVFESLKLNDPSHVDTGAWNLMDEMHVGNGSGPSFCDHHSNSFDEDIFYSDLMWRR